MLNREIDALLLRHVWEMTVYESFDEWWGVTEGRPSDLPCAVWTDSQQCYWIERRDKPHEYVRLSSTWEGMGLVIERLTALGWAVDLRKMYDKELWTVMLWQAEPFFDAEAETPFMAVAIAALRVKGVEVAA